MWPLAWLALGLAACAPTAPPGPVPVDRAAASEAASHRVLSPERLRLEGAAAWQATTAADLVARRAVTAEEVRRAAERLASGAAPDGPAAVVQLTAPDVTEGLYQSGTAYLPGAFSPAAPPEAFDMSLTFGLVGGDGASVGLSIELRDPSDEPAGDVGQLLVTLMDPGVGVSAQLTVSTRAARPGAPFEPVGSAPLAARDWRGAHRVRLRYTPGELAVSLDGEPVVTAPVRLDRPAGPVYVGAFASVPTMGTTLLDWTLTELPPPPPSR